MSRFFPLLLEACSHPLSLPSGIPFPFSPCYVVGSVLTSSLSALRCSQWLFCFVGSFLCEMHQGFRWDRRGRAGWGGGGGGFFSIATAIVVTPPPLMAVPPVVRVSQIQSTAPAPVHSTSSLESSPVHANRGENLKIAEIIQNSYLSSVT